MMHELKKYHSSHRNIEDRAATSAEAHQVQGSLKSKRIWQGRRRCCGISMLHLWDQNRTKHKEDTGAALSSVFGSVLEVEPKCKVYLSATSMAMGEKESRLSSRRKAAKTTNSGKSPHAKKVLDVVWGVSFPISRGTDTPMEKRWRAAHNCGFAGIPISVVTVSVFLMKSPICQMYLISSLNPAATEHSQGSGRHKVHNFSCKQWTQIKWWNKPFVCL